MLFGAGFLVASLVGILFVILACLAIFIALKLRSSAAKHPLAEPD